MFAGGYAFVSLIFDNNKDVNLTYLNNSIEDFMKKYNRIEGEPFPMLTAILKRDNPLDYEETKSYCVAVNPMTWGLCSSDADTLPNMFKMTFVVDNFLFYEVAEE